MDIGVLVAPYGGELGRPEDRPIGRAALALASSGVQVIFGHEAQNGRLMGVRARRGRWESASARIAGAYDRFPSRTRAVAHAALREALVDVPIVNAPAMVQRCADKLRCQEALAGLRMPEVQDDPSRFVETLKRWGAAFLKPRYGAFGRGVTRVVPGDPLPARGPGAVRGEEEPLFLQRAVPPPEGWAGVACRVLVQREPTGGWFVCEPVARRHRHDPVVNAARGADVAALVDMAPESVPEARRLARQAAEMLALQPQGEGLVEVGVDLVLDVERRPWLIEVNSRPRGRLEKLAAADPERFEHLHAQACARPLHYLAARRNRT